MSDVTASVPIIDLGLEKKEEDNRFQAKVNKYILVCHVISNIFFFLLNACTNHINQRLAVNYFCS